MDVKSSQNIGFGTSIRLHEKVTRLVNRNLEAGKILKIIDRAAKDGFEYNINIFPAKTANNIRASVRTNGNDDVIQRITSKLIKSKSAPDNCLEDRIKCIYEIALGFIKSHAKKEAEKQQAQEMLQKHTYRT